jgi:transposase
MTNHKNEIRMRTIPHETMRFKARISDSLTGREFHVLRVLKDSAFQFKRIGFEAGPLSQWLFDGLAKADLPVVCIETRHTKAFLKAQVNKTDKSDARGIAQMIRVNLFRPVHVKTLASQKRRALLTGRKLLQEKAIAIENDICGLVRNFGLKVGTVGVIKFENRIRELVDSMPDLADITDAPLIARRRIREQYPQRDIARQTLVAANLRLTGKTVAPFLKSPKNVSRARTAHKRAYCFAANSRAATRRETDN